MEIQIRRSDFLPDSGYWRTNGSDIHTGCADSETAKFRGGSEGRTVNEKHANAHVSNQIVVFTGISLS